MNITNILRITYFEKHVRKCVSVLCRTIFQTVELANVEIFRDRFIKKTSAYRFEDLTVLMSWKDF